MQKRSADPKQNRDMEEGKEVKPEEIDAKYENGVLTLNIPNKQAAVEEKKNEVKQIEVK